MRFLELRIGLNIEQPGRSPLRPRKLEVLEESASSEMGIRSFEARPHNSTGLSLQPLRAQKRTFLIRLKYFTGSPGVKGFFT
jgi:hypothetical protein